MEAFRRSFSCWRTTTPTRNSGRGRTNTAGRRFSSPRATARKLQAGARDDPGCDALMAEEGLSTEGPRPRHIGAYEKARLAKQKP